MIEIKRNRVYISRDIAVSPDIVWQCITNTEKWCQWGPSVTAVQCDQQFICENSRGRVKTAIGFWLPFEILTFKKKSFWNWRVGGIDATGHRVEQLEEKGTRLIFDMPVWAIVYLLVCYIALRRIDRLCRDAR